MNGAEKQHYSRVHRHVRCLATLSYFPAGGDDTLLTHYISITLNTAWLRRRKTGGFKVTAEVRGILTVPGGYHTVCMSFISLYKSFNGYTVWKGKSGGQLSGDERTLFSFTVLQARHVDVKCVNRWCSKHMHTLIQQHKKQTPSQVPYFWEL